MRVTLECKAIHKILITLSDFENVYFLILQRIEYIACV